MSVQYTFPAGEIVQDVTEVVLVNNTAKIVDYTVPVGSKMLLISVKAVNMDNVTRNILVDVYKEVAKTNLMLRLAVGDIATTKFIQYPNTYRPSEVDRVHAPMVLVLTEGNTISVTWAAGGASAGATDADGLVITGLEVPL